MPEGKRSLGRPRRKWIDWIYLRVIGWGVVNWTDLAHDKDWQRTPVNMGMNLLVS
jgi:hypothetical protein